MTRPKCPRCARPMQRHGKGWRCRDGSGDRKLCYSTTQQNPTSIRDHSGNAKAPPPVFKRTLPAGAKRYIVTAAQNATPIHEGFWKALQVAAKHLHAEILVIPFRYKNPTSTWTASQEGSDVWDPKLVPFLWNQRLSLNSNAVVLGDLKTQPTASSPLSGFDAMTGGESGIIGHTKLQCRVIAAPSNKFPKILTTTGAVTRANYTDSKAGKLGEFHHTLGAVLVEVVNDKVFHLRHLNANKVSGAFTDLDKTYTSTGVSDAARPLALVMGDTHVDFIDPAVERATFGDGGIVQSLNPKTLVWHDLLDGYSVNPHHIGNPFLAVAKRKYSQDDVAAEVARAIEFVQSRTLLGRQSVVVNSNHDDFLRRWMFSTDWRTDPTNAAFYLRTALALVEAIKNGDTEEFPSPLGLWFARANTQNIRVLGPNESYALAGVELSMHGHVGPNGSRGSIRNLRRVGVRSIIGHSHTPGIDEGSFQVGTSTRLRLGYNLGPSSWLNAHAVLHADGKRQLIFIINGAWRL